ncbi:hypothetical protein AAF712_014999 [Marasmius tenuissimus]|uniref:Uncharacterized protein n=1 Tax=Marasmius tenuissimus TaxID=585030 RepID=A0ABR2Z9S4_9AGAR
MSAPISYARVLRNKKEFGGTQVAEIVLKNFDTSALLCRRQAQQAELEGSNDDQPSLLERPTSNQRRHKSPSLTPLVQLSKPLPFASLLPSVTQRAPSSYIPDPTKTSKQLKNVRSRNCWREKRDSKRISAQQEAGTALKQCAIRKVARTLQDKKTVITLQHNLIENLEQRKGGSWTGRKVEHNDRTYTLDEVLSIPGMQLIENDGSKTIVIQDAEMRNTTTCLQIPDHSSWPDEMANFLALLDWSEEELRHQKGATKGRRGNYATTPTGISFGGGQTSPGNFAQTDIEKQIWEKVYAHPFYQRVLRYANHGMKSYYPKLERLYTNVKEKIRINNPSLVDPLPKCCFSACNLNMGRAVTLQHTDFLNLLFGQCAVLSMGDFNYKKGGHIVLWDFGLVIEFPPGSMILLPSALVEHSNVSIAGHERRSSITFYSASGLFRWVTNGYMSDKEFKARASTKMRQRWDEHRANLWKDGLELLSK